MTPPIFTVCSADAGVTALLGRSPVRLYPFGEAPQDTAKPYAAWQMIAGNPDNYLAGRPDVDGYTLQVDVYAPTAAAVRNIAQALRNAIELNAHVVRWSGESRDAATKVYRYSFDVHWIVQR